MSPGQSEINNLKEALRKLPQEKDDEKKREVLKKVIAYMTLGIDVSKLFPEIIMMSSTNDIIQKKMIYLYLNNYAETNSELSLLTINTLQKDSKDDDPIIRGLALRSFCNLRINNLFEYIEGPLFNGLNDKNSYVRRIAIISCIKLIKMNPQINIKNDVIKILKNKLLDKDSQCIINSVHALNEILADEGGLKVNKEIIFNMLNKISTFNEWGKCVILNIVSTYIPEDEDEMFDIMNILENHIRDYSTTVFLACLKCFLNLSANDTDLQIKIFNRMKEPLLTLITTSSYEISYIILLHSYILLHESNKLKYDIFDYDYKHFFFRYNDPTYIKDIKLDILVAISSKNNVSFITNELSEYISDSNVDIAQKSIYSIGCIALKIPKSISRVVDLALCSFLPMKSPHICGATIKMLGNILRKYDEYTKVIIEEVIKHDNKLIDDVGIISYIWIIGEYCEYIENAPYILEEYVNLTDCSYIFMLELLTACLKVLYRRPSEMKIILVSLFQNILNNYKYPELTDKLFFYYKLLYYNYEEAFNIIAAKKNLVTNFCESNENTLLDKLYNEFNTLSILYKYPTNKHIQYSKICFSAVYDPEENTHGTNTYNDSGSDAGEACDANKEHSHNKLYNNREINNYNEQYDHVDHPQISHSVSDDAASHLDNNQNTNLININDDVGTVGNDISADENVDSHRNNIHNYKGHGESMYPLDNSPSAIKKNNHSPNTKNDNKNTFNSQYKNRNSSKMRTPTNNDTISEEKRPSLELLDMIDSDNFEKLKEILIYAENITPEEYQEQWNLLPEQNNEKLFLRKNYYNLQLESLDELISRYNIIILASGEIDQCLKFYMYSQFYTKHYVFIEFIFNKIEYSINWVLKSQSDNADMVDQFTDCFRDIFIDFM
ncbi:AP-4 complex subunit beta, putative [Plasmodium chabaudi chabaudi]|uniref:AP complex subunit beta n=1 Tax=Plasmodium chabaudi chabaudi TaxID=31271 RepID=A0A077TIM7_PLACU|nr:AP-4 complex subunit beta, putative [Plasmodium chabaudi chabaudi]SCL96949.1 AP-4 complex subunit beta, putative [Plasmodium chabaudi chabaudi]VTZ66905.1 AP-4 complex subunit beta, putative [Plasmodium chabaudi chabaudi]|eukprot:XP_016653116.1 AP-4 complex subunit beta, putative [Plasmodium chabaudi chabaudi]